MLLQGRPLYDNMADFGLFVRPRPWDQIMRAIDRRLNLLILGARGSGKTTLLRQIQLALRDQGERVAFVDATAVDDIVELAERILDAVRGEPAPRGIGAGIRAGAEIVIGARSSAEEPIAGSSRHLAELLSAVGAEAPTTILLDASGSAEAVFRLFGTMRDTLWQQEHRWVAAIDIKDRATVMRPPADAFFDRVDQLGPWSEAEIDELLKRRSEADMSLGGLIHRTAAVAEGNPREAIRIFSRGIVSDEDPSVLRGERAGLLERALALGEPAMVLMSELLERDQAGQSDIDLQVALGVSRVRLNQLFRQLEEADLVTSESARPDGPGRPRTIYRPNLRP